MQRTAKEYKTNLNFFKDKVSFIGLCQRCGKLALYKKLCDKSCASENDIIQEQIRTVVSIRSLSPFLYLAKISRQFEVFLKLGRKNFYTIKS